MGSFCWKTGKPSTMLSSIDLLRRSGYEVKYFSDTDTALVEFTENEIAETREISENFYVDLDRQRNPVSMTIEHARTNARLQEFWYQEVPRPPQEESRST